MVQRSVISTLFFFSKVRIFPKAVGQGRPTQAANPVIFSRVGKVGNMQQYVQTPKLRPKLYELYYAK